MSSMLLCLRLRYGDTHAHAQQKYEDAAEQFSKAANCYKVARQMKEAGDLYVRTAGLHEKLKSAHEAASAYTEVRQTASVLTYVMCHLTSTAAVLCACA
jgi:hypothetical protein